MIEIPTRLRARPRKAGLPVPYINVFPPGGEPDFRTVDGEKVIECLDKRLCGLCGQRLGREVVLIGSEEEIERRHFHDPAMHPECAIYATKACPFLANPKRQYSKMDPKHLPAGEQVDTTFQPADARPANRMGLVYSPGAALTFRDGKPWATVYQITRIDWDAIPHDNTEGAPDAGTDS